MSWASTIAGSITTPNKSSRNGRKVTGWIIHHNAARGGLGVLEMMRTGSKQVSTQNQVLENGDVWGVVPREDRSWSASNAAWDGSSITFEIANNSGAPGWTISDRAYDQVARTIAEDARWAGIPINRSTVRGHREGSADPNIGGSYSTACPGGINLDYLVDLANHYYTENEDPAPGNPDPRKEEDMTETVIIGRLNEAGEVDGEWSVGGRDFGAADGHRPFDTPLVDEAERQQGYRVSENWDEVSQEWRRQFAQHVDGRDEAGRPKFVVWLPRAEYIEHQAFFRAISLEYERTQRDLIKMAFSEER